MFQRFWLSPLLMVAALKHRKIGPQNKGLKLLLDHPKAFAISSLNQPLSHLPSLLWFISGGVLLLSSLYRLTTLQDTLMDQEHQLYVFQKNLEERKKDLALLRRFKLEKQAYLLSQMLNTSHMTRFELGIQLKSLAQKSGFKAMSFRLAPQNKTALKPDLWVYLTSVTIFYNVKTESQLLEWIQHLYDHFPCFLILRRLTVERNLSSQGRLEGLRGTLVLDWLVLDGAS